MVGFIFIIILLAFVFLCLFLMFYSKEINDLNQAQVNSLVSFKDTNDLLEEIKETISAKVEIKYNQKYSYNIRNKNLLAFDIKKYYLNDFILITQKGHIIHDFKKCEYGEYDNIGYIGLVYFDESHNWKWVHWNMNGNCIDNFFLEKNNYYGCNLCMVAKENSWITVN